MKPGVIRAQELGSSSMIGLLLVAAIAGSPTSTADACRADEPFVATAMMAGMTNSPSGVVVAVWPDGRILRAKLASNPRKGHVAGRLTDAQMAQLTKVVSQSTIWKWEQPSMPFDVREDLIMVCSGNSRRSLTDMSGAHPQSPQRRLERYLRNIKVPEPQAATVPEEWIDWFREEGR